MVLGLGLELGLGYRGRRVCISEPRRRTSNLSVFCRSEAEPKKDRVKNKKSNTKTKSKAGSKTKKSNTNTRAKDRV
jgi:hypothetical protein